MRSFLCVFLHIGHKLYMNHVIFSTYISPYITLQLFVFGMKFKDIDDFLR